MGVKERWHRYRPLPADILDRIKTLPALFKQKDVKLAYLFGSLTRGGGNDVDIALLYEGDFASLREVLQKKLGSWRLDLVNLETAPIRVAFEIISKGRLIYKQDEEIENSFEINVIKQYQDLKPMKAKQITYLKENMGIGT